MPPSKQATNSPQLSNKKRISIAVPTHYEQGPAKRRRLATAVFKNKLKEQELEEQRQKSLLEHKNANLPQLEIEEGDADNLSPQEKLAVLEEKLDVLSTQKHKLFLSLKSILHEDEKRKQKEELEKKKIEEEQRKQQQQAMGIPLGNNIMNYNPNQLLQSTYLNMQMNMMPMNMMGYSGNQSLLGVGSNDNLMGSSGTSSPSPSNYGNSSNSLLQSNQSLYLNLSMNLPMNMVPLSNMGMNMMNMNSNSNSNLNNAPSSPPYNYGNSNKTQYLQTNRKSMYGSNSSHSGGYRDSYSNYGSGSGSGNSGYSNRNYGSNSGGGGSRSSYGYSNSNSYSNSDSQRYNSRGSFSSSGGSGGSSSGSGRGGNNLSSPRSYPPNYR